MCPILCLHEDRQCEDGSSIIPWSPPDRQSVQEATKKQEFDILVIGGGATGSGVALDAATRGLKVALVEQEDFASGTSSRSTKLIHGGIRYLALAFQAKIPPRSLWDLLANVHYDHSMMQVVMHDLKERTFMMHSAPFMTKTLPMMIPLNHWCAARPHPSHSPPFPPCPSQTSCCPATNSGEVHLRGRSG